MTFAYRNGVLCAEQVPLDDIARRFGTPCYVYSRAAIEAADREHARAHRYISTGLRESKFGIAYADAERIYAAAARQPHIEVVGIGCHIGSQLTRAAPFVEAAGRIAALADRLGRAGIALKHIDIGG